MSLLNSILRSREEVETMRDEAKTLREQIYQRGEGQTSCEGALRASTLDNHHWSGTRLVYSPTERIVAKIREEEVSYIDCGWIGSQKFVGEWRTTDGSGFATLPAAKKHQESLVK